MREAGYSTAAFVTAAWCSRMYGYDRGFDVFHEFFDLALFVRIIREYEIGYYANLVDEQKITKELFFDRIGPVLEIAFPALSRFCLDKLEETVRGGVVISPKIHDWEFAKIIQIAREEQAVFSASPVAYMENLIVAWKTHRLFGLTGSALAVPPASSAGYVIEHVKQWLDKPIKAPFFIWAHLMDVHDSNYTTFDFALADEDDRREKARIEDMAVNIRRKGSAYTSDASHDFALSYVDEQIKRLHAYLANKDLLKDTIIVLPSDHGSRTAGYPRPDFKDITAFYDQLYHIPFALVSERFPPQRLDQLCSSMDIAPTLLDMAGLPLPPEYRGAPVYSHDTVLRDHLIMEHVGRGPCDMEIKPINVCIRTKREKAIFKSSHT